MKNVEFYLNGRNVEGGKILSYSITNEMAFKVVELVNRIGESQDIIAKIKYDVGEDGERIYHVLVDSVTTDPIEDLSEVEEEDEVLEIFTGNREEIDGWNSLVEKEQEVAERRAANERAWDAINVDHYPIDVIRKYFDSYNITGSMGYSYNKKPFKTFDISVVPDMEIAVKGELIDTKFGINTGHLKDGEKIYKY